jgi:hypothetical protein
MSPEAMSPAELRRAGIKALYDALGPTGMAEFMRMFDGGYGNYTKDREKILGKKSVDEIYEEIKGKKSALREK